MRFWDASAVVPLLIEEEPTAAVHALLERDPAMTVWWGTEVECASALSRLERTGELPEPIVTAGLSKLDRLVAEWNEIEPLSAIRRTARRLVRVHPLRAADALQLAAAITLSEGDASTLSFVCTDERLIEAARREGFVILDPRAS